MAQRKGCLIGCAVALVPAAGVLVALFLGLGKMVDVAGKILLDPTVYTSVNVGDPEGEVRAKLPSGDTFVRTALKEAGPAEPAGSVCAWYVSTDDKATEDVLRFCFKDGKLAEKARYRMK
ncbi:hypothetical protein [Streptomyces sp. NPDC001389]|uniref:hypothetical protein n=1 Tax=unclassified Streptomyces TaxID=2593676 RepID=UPI0036786D40